MRCSGVLRDAGFSDCRPFYRLPYLSDSSDVSRVVERLRLDVADADVRVLVAQLLADSVNAHARRFAPFVISNGIMPRGFEAQLAAPNVRPHPQAVRYCSVMDKALYCGASRTADLLDVVPHVMRSRAGSLFLGCEIASCMDAQLRPVTSPRLMLVIVGK